MADLPPGAAEIVVDVERIAAQPGDAADRVRDLMTVLHRLVPYVASMVYVLEPELREFELVGGSGYSDKVLAYLRGPGHYREMEQLGMDRDRSPMCVRDAPIPPAELASWAEHLEPAGFREGVGVTLFSPDGRHLGLVVLHTDDPAYPSDEARDFLGLLAPLISDVVDPMYSIATLAKIVTDAQAGVVLTRAGNALSLPGLAGHPLLRVGSPVFAVATESLADGQLHTCFLCPYRSPDGVDGHVRITVLPCPPSAPAYLKAVVLTSPPGTCAG